LDTPFAPSAEPSWFVVHGRWLYQLTQDDVWVLAAEFEAKEMLSRNDVYCFANPADCSDAVVNAAKATAGPTNLD
jgi:hypothetical protein